MKDQIKVITVGIVGYPFKCSIMYNVKKIIQNNFSRILGKIPCLIDADYVTYSLDLVLDTTATCTINALPYVTFKLI